MNGKAETKEMPMRLYLVQHGEALPKDQDPDRPLTERGEVDTRHVGRFLADHRITVESLYHSGKTRARQTAEILGECVCPGLLPEAMDGLAPNDPTAPVAEQAARWSRDTLLVGHLPFMGRLAAALTAGAEEPVTVGFQPGSAVCLEHDPDRGWQLAFMVRPDLLR
jgi:phosphohistidine phosphatase